MRLGWFSQECFQVGSPHPLHTLNLLQLADLVARPLGMMHLRPGQPNRIQSIIEAKLRKDPTGEVRGYGLKIFPS